MKKSCIMDGNEACATAAYLFTEVAGIYPITPSSPMATLCDKWSSANKKNIFNDKVNVVQMQSEAGAAGLVHGSLQAGALTTTFTASQGLLLMIPSMYKIAGEMLPGVIHVASRSLATHALSIFGDHQDVYACRQTGFIMLSSANVQDAYNLSIVAHLSAIKSSLPVLHFFDGFRTSHELNKIEILDEEEVIKLVDKNAINDFKKRSINLGKNITRGTSQTEDVYFQNTEIRNKYYEDVPDVVNDYMNQINKLTKKDYKPFTYYGSRNAKNIIVAMGSVCDTIRATIDNMKEEVGLITCHLYRPFSKKYFLDVLPKTVVNIAVLDRTKEAGSAGEPLYLDVCEVLKDADISVIGGRYGLSSKDTTPADIKAVFDNLNSNNKVNSFTISINDDVTFKSLPRADFTIKKDTQDLKVYGFGSDGMVSGVKNVLKVIGEKENTYVQGYFEYDSKKSGGVTIGHVRIGNHQINLPFYPDAPKVVVVTKDTYINKFDLIKNIMEKGTFILCTNKSKKELNHLIPNEMKNIIVNRKVRFLLCNTFKLSEDFGLKGKINAVISKYLLDILNSNSDDINRFKELIKKTYSSKGEEIVNKNISSIERAYEYLEEFYPSDFTDEEIKTIKYDNITDIMLQKSGSLLKVSDFEKYKDGTFEGGTSKCDRSSISNIVPNWNKDNCIMCNQCSFVCPHGVIRPYELTLKQIDEAGIDISETKEIIGSDKRYYLAISQRNCTGCGLCINTCPGFKANKALSPKENDSKNQSIFDYLASKHNSENNYNKFTVKGIAYEKPFFEFPGACAGCGETPYIRILTNLYGKEIVVANATGCSSIYGASLPSTPYSLPWINSLFEDNAEFGLGINTAYVTMRNRIKNIFGECKGFVNDNVNKQINKWLENINDYKATNEVKEVLEKEEIPEDLKPLLDYIPYRTVWIVGGDGWAYDIDYGGLDHVLSTNENVKILVLDTEVYSNTGGQKSKSTKIGAVAEFANNGKKNYKKDLFKIACDIPNVYVASICLGANMSQAIKAFKEAQEHEGPSLIIAYSPCIEHGLSGGLSNALNEEKLLVESGYNLLMRYNPNESKLYLDQSVPDFTKYKEVFENELRYKNLAKSNPEEKEKLYQMNLENAKRRYEYFLNKSKETL